MRSKFSLQGLTVLGVEHDHAAVKNLENSLVWLSRACPIKELTMMLSFSISRKKTDSQKVLFSEVCKALERRWVEIKGNLGESLPETRKFTFAVPFTMKFTLQLPSFIQYQKPM